MEKNAVNLQTAPSRAKCKLIVQIVGFNFLDLA